MEAIDTGGLTTLLTWIGILFCLSQSAIFSGLNLAYFSVSRLRLEIEVANGNPEAANVLALRKDSNRLLATVLWGNVAINVLLTLLSNSVMLGATAFLFSTFVITLGGEILPQAYFSRNALRMGSMLSPVLRFYRILLFPVTKPTAFLLDQWLGKEGVQYFRERDLRQLINKHMDAADTDLDALEGIGALNFLAIDDVPVSQEGELIAEDTLIPFESHREFTEGKWVTASADTVAQFNDRITKTHHRWMILLDADNNPMWMMDADAYLRAIHTRAQSEIDPLAFCHKPVVVTNPGTRLGTLIGRIKENTAADSDAPIPSRAFLLWAEEKKIITNADIFGRLFKGIGLYSSLSDKILNKG